MVPALATFIYERGERGESRKGQFYVNLITEWPLITLYHKIRQKFITKCVRFFVTKCDSTLMLLVHKKNYQEIIKINITKLFFKIVCFFNRNTPAKAFLIAF